MAVDAETKREIEKQAKLYDAAKEEVITRIQDNTETAIKKLKSAEKTLLVEVEAEFGENPFKEFLTKIDSGSTLADAEVKNILDRRIPKSIGPSEEAFRSLLCEIESFKSWREKLVPIPSKVSV